MCAAENSRLVAHLIEAAAGCVRRLLTAAAALRVEERVRQRAGRLFRADERFEFLRALTGEILRIVAI